MKMAPRLLFFAGFFLGCTLQGMECYDLYEAITTGDEHKLHAIIEGGVNWSRRFWYKNNYYDYTYFNPIELAIENDKRELIPILIAGGAHFDLYARLPSIESWLVKLFLEMGRNVDHQSNCDDSVFYDAVFNENIEVIKTLIKCNAHQSTENKKGKTVYSHIARQPHVSALIKKRELLRPEKE